MSALATVENLKSLAALLAASRRAKTTAEKMAVWDTHLTEIIKRIAPDMAQNKLTTAIATDMVNRIEALQRQIDDIYAEANRFDGTGNSNVIRDAVQARAELRDAEFRSSDLLASFDVEEDQ